MAGVLCTLVVVAFWFNSMVSNQYIFAGFSAFAGSLLGIGVFVPILISIIRIWNAGFWWPELPDRGLRLEIIGGCVLVATIFSAIVLIRIAKRRDADPDPV